MEGVVVHHVSSWCAGGVDPGWWQELGDAVVGEADVPVSVVDVAVVVGAEQHTVVVAGGSAV
jgi:hypothetical protein